MKSSDDLDWLALERLYDEGRRLFLRGKHEAALELFKRIFEDTLELGYVAEAVEDYYSCLANSGLPNTRFDSKNEMP